MKRINFYSPIYTPCGVRIGSMSENWKTGLYTRVRGIAGNKIQCNTIIRCAAIKNVRAVIPYYIYSESSEQRNHYTAAEKLEINYSISVCGSATYEPLSP